MSGQGFTRRGLLTRLAALPAAFVAAPAVLAVKSDAGEEVREIAMALPSLTRGAASGELVIQQVVERAFLRDLATNGPMAQRIMGGRRMTITFERGPSGELLLPYRLEHQG